MKHLALLIGLWFCGNVLYAQTAEALLKKVVTKLNTVKDYSASAKVAASIPMIKIAASQATIYFKQKNKFKVVSKGIVILPKQNFTDMNAFIGNPNAYQAILGDSAVVNSVKTVLVTVIPSGETNDIVLAKLWVDPKQNVIMKSQITSKTNGTITSTYTYGSQLAFGLPDKLVFEIDVKKFKLPKSVAADINNKKKTSTKTGTKGTITITMSNYAINKGINDAVFSK
jgi:outer membrane lipoprotein-sorting protein